MPINTESRLIQIAKTQTRALLFETLRPAMRSIRDMVRKPVLRYLEIHLADHCNLNCKGCGHYSPVAGERFVDLKQMSADLRRLSELFRNVAMIRLMGGEPLLFSAIAEAIALSREFMPRADIRVVTNGVLLPKMSAEFWQAMKQYSVNIDMTKYPVTLDLDRIRGLGAEHGVRIEISECNTFLGFLNLKGDFDPRGAMDKCRSHFYTPFLQDGRLFVCSQPATVHHFNRQFNMSIPEDGGIDIHDRRLTGRHILSLLEQPVSTCQFCTVNEYKPFDWKVSKRQIAEWEA